MNKRWYRGWPNLFIAALAMVATMPSRTFGLGLITEKLIADFGISRVSYASINLWSTLIGALFCLPVGRLLDKLGARGVLTATAAALGLSILLMTGWAHSWATLFLAYTLLRGFGQSALSVASLGLVGKWFGRRLPMAMGIFSILISLGFVAVFLATGQQVLAAGWRSAWSGLGYAVLFGLAPLAAIFARSGPTASESKAETVVATAKSEPSSWTLADALRANMFWALSVGSASYAFISSALLLFQESILKTLGFGPETFQAVQAVSLGAGLAANFVTGWLAERRGFSMPRLLAFGLLLQAVLLAALPHLTTTLHAYVYGAGMGAAGGIATVIFFAAWGRTFGQGHVGHIQGAAQLLTVLASAAGPLVVAEAYERMGSYLPALTGLAPIYLILGAWCWLVRSPRLTWSEIPVRVDACASSSLAPRDLSAAPQRDG